MLIDGAHALGALHLDLRSLDPDYYVSNAHKWFCAPKGCAFMYVKKELQSQTRPLIISHGFGSGFNSEFIWAGIFIFHLTSFSRISTCMNMSYIILIIHTETDGLALI